MDHYNSLLNLTILSPFSFKVNSQKPLSDHALESGNICLALHCQEMAPELLQTLPKAQEPALIFYSVSLPTPPRAPHFSQICVDAVLTVLCISAQAALPQNYPSSSPIPPPTAISSVTLFLHSHWQQTLPLLIPIEFCTSLIIHSHSCVQLHIDFPRKKSVHKKIISIPTIMNRQGK